MNLKVAYMRFLRQLALLTIFSVINIVVVLCIVDPQRSSAGPAISAGDANGDTTVDIADAVYVLSYLFQGGPAPVAIAQTGLTAEQEEILSHMSIEYLDDGVGGTVKTVRFTEVNVQVVNGLGATNGNPSDATSFTQDDVVTNGVGNLIVGYREDWGGGEPSLQNGSHNVVVGSRHRYSSVGCIMGGYRNESEAPYAMTLGWRAIASGSMSSVLGGNGNHAEAFVSVVCGGSGNSTEGNGSSILGGSSNVTTGLSAAIAGGQGNTAESGAILGGRFNSVTDQGVCVGGYENQASNDALVVGGTNNAATGQYSVLGGGSFNLVEGARSVVTGGFQNNATGGNAVTSGGSGRNAPTEFSWTAGDLMLPD